MNFSFNIFAWLHDAWQVYIFMNEKKYIYIASSAWHMSFVFQRVNLSSASMCLFLDSNHDSLIIV